MYQATLHSEIHLTTDPHATQYTAESASGALDLAYTEAQTRWGSDRVEIIGDEVHLDGAAIGIVEWIETEAERIARAAAHLGAVRLLDGSYAYRADETRRWYVLEPTDVESLCDYLDDPRMIETGNAYSRWCADTASEEMPADWTPDTD